MTSSHPPDPERFEERLLQELRAHVAERPAPAAADAASTPSRSASRSRTGSRRSAPAGPGAPRASAAGPLGAPRGSRRRTPPRLALAGVGVAAVATAIVVASGGDPAEPAYAVESNRDGSVTVEINSLRDAAGLQSKLRAAGVQAVVDYLPEGKACRAGRFSFASGRPRSGVAERSRDAAGPTTSNGAGALPPQAGGPSAGAQAAPQGEAAPPAGSIERSAVARSRRVGDEPPSADGTPPPTGAGGAVSVRTSADGSATFTIGDGTLAAGETLVITSTLGASLTAIGTAVAEGPVGPCELVDAPAGSGAKNSPPTFEASGGSSAPG